MNLKISDKQLVTITFQHLSIDSKYLRKQPFKLLYNISNAMAREACELSQNDPMQQKMLTVADQAYEIMSLIFQQKERKRQMQKERMESIIGNNQQKEMNISKTISNFFNFPSITSIFKTTNLNQDKVLKKQ